MNLEILTVCNAEDGSAAFSSESITLRPGPEQIQKDPALMSAAASCKRYFFARFPAGFSDSRTFAGRRQLCVLLSGRVEISMQDGEVKALGAGEFVMFEDTEFASPTRAIKVLGDEPALVLTVQLE